jgi:photosystem II stability/assembly factor-like uncharacterized protein
MARIFPITLWRLGLFGLLCMLLLGACSPSTSAASSQQTAGASVTAAAGPAATPRLDVPTNTWAPLHTPGRVTDLAVSPANTATVFICVTQANAAIAVYRSDNRGAAWQRLSIPSGSGNCVLSADPANARRLYLALGQPDNIALYKSTDGGVHWSAPLASSTTFVNGQIQFVDNGLETLVYTPTADQPGLVRLERSTDGGKIWQPIDQPLLNQGVLVLSVIADPLSATTMLALTQQNPAQAYSAEALRGGLWRSSDAGAAWSEVSSNVPLNGELLAGADGQHIYAFAPGVPILKESEDGGQTWLTLNLSVAATAPSAGLLRATQLVAGEKGVLYLALNQGSGAALYVYSPQSHAWQATAGVPAFSGSRLIFFTDGMPGTLWLTGAGDTLDRYIPGS